MHSFTEIKDHDTVGEDVSKNVLWTWSLMTIFFMGAQSVNSTENFFGGGRFESYRKSLRKAPRECWWQDVSYVVKRVHVEGMMDSLADVYILFDKRFWGSIESDLLNTARVSMTPSRLIPRGGMIHFHVLYDSFTCVAWLILVCLCRLHLSCTPSLTN